MPTRFKGYMGRMLQIDLSARQVSEYPVTDEQRERYLGGKVLAARILADLITGPIDPFGPENVVVITTGPLTGTGAPMATRFNVSTISPLTGLLASSNCGGSFGLHLKKAGYDGLVITGRAEAPVWLEITEDGVRFHDASHLWGMTTSETQAALPPRAGKLVIGPAGENRVRFAGLASDDRMAARAGGGAVFGSKNLKALVAYGRKTVPVARPERVKALYKEWAQALRSHPITGNQLPRLGTAGLLAGMQAHRMLATRNFSRGRFDQFDAVSGETLAEEHLIRNGGCAGCPVHCGREVLLPEEPPNAAETAAAAAGDGRKGRRVKGPELETLVLLGPNLENADLSAIIRWNYLLDELGMDSISTGGTIAFAMELNEKGLWENGLRFGEVENLPQLFDDIAHRRGIGDLLAEGSRRLAQRFGGMSFAMQVKGLELPAYEPRGAVGQGLGYAVANRGGCHLNAGYLAVLEGLGLEMDPHTPRGKAALTILMQDLMEGISAAGNCLFSSYDVFPAPLLHRPNGWLTRTVNRLLPWLGPAVALIHRLPWLPMHLPGLPVTRALEAVTGMKMDLGRLKGIGERGYNLERLVNVRLGVTAADDDLPERLKAVEQVPGDPRTRVPLEVMKRQYYRLRGWTPDGVPTPRLLRRLGLQ
ncbi:MAG: aldehyde ferredoxin oxidoreductase family protein [Symbiobacterium sp.]|uniref:aldehyde ferredoxin oxidoreductase family protein n=1 Tax=Symbiobacterium sp. TaxID=1971213 RepID=UPI00346495DB